MKGLRHILFMVILTMIMDSCSTTRVLQDDEYRLAKNRIEIKNDKKFKTKEISKQINSARLSFAPPEYMEKFLDITPGSVSVLGLMNDKDNRVKLLIDEEVLKDEFFGCHPCINTSSLRLRTADLMEKIIPAMDHTPTFVELPWLE